MWIGDANLPITVRALNSLPENPKQRLYRTLVPISVLADFDINPHTWKNPGKLSQVRLDAEQGDRAISMFDVDKIPDVVARVEGEACRCLPHIKRLLSSFQGS